MSNITLQSVLQLRQNYWFLPSILTAVALVLGFLLPYVDTLLGVEWMAGVPFVRPMGVDGARAVLTTLGTAILGVAGVAFSITIVAVSFASGNYGPRLIGNFMRDRTNQVVLAIFVATFVYCVTVLSTVHARYEDLPEALASFVPQVSVLFAVFLALVSVGALIVYIHHVPESINIMNLVSGIGGKLERSIIVMCDEEEARHAERGGSVDVGAWPSPEPTDKLDVRAPEGGYLQQIDLKALDRLARKHDLHVFVRTAPGDFVARGDVVVAISPTARAEGKRESIERYFTLGSSRTEEQDIAFLSDQLVEVLARALSAGVNDPHTAMLCLDWLRAGLSAFATRRPGPPTSHERVHHTRVTFEGLVERTFGRMRQYISGDRNVTLYAITVLADLAAAASSEERAEVVAAQMRALAQSAEEMLTESAARQEVADHLREATDAISARRAGTRTLPTPQAA
ncbi:DUF2254 domain-containing protein [Acuticoccus sp.]|uniref:DUF2254 domain-containing protein n=1 Tax=Acuticoccus sp. TaxID=1904378 RepID=UPI003B52DB61